MRFKRKPKKDPTEVLLGVLNSVTVRHYMEHKVVVEHKPHPRPTRIWFNFQNQEGQRYQGIPVPIYGRQTMMYPFPLAWITGRPADPQVQVEVNLEYE